MDTLWSGRVTDPEDALRLLLIMDYVFDWARDVYRKNTIDQLLALAANPTPTLAADTDMLTVAGGQPHDFCQDFDLMENRPHREPLDERGYGTPDLFEMFDIDHPTTAVIRDARYMVHDVLGIDITPDSFDDLFQSLSKDANGDRVLARKIQRAICPEHVWRVSAATLDAIELLWTGCDREHIDFRDNDANFLVNFSISSHLNGSITNERKLGSNESCWYQRHTLKFVAVAETAIELLSEKSQYRAKNLINGLDVTTDKALDMFRKVRYATVRQCLAAALASVQRMTSRSLVTSENPRRSSRDDKPIFENVMKTHQTSELPVEVYRALKTGRSEPDKPFLRLSSSRFQEQIVKENDAFHWLTNTRLISENDDVVFAYANHGTANREQRQSRSHCIFVIDPTRTMSDPSSHSSVNEMSAQSAEGHEKTQQAQAQHMSIFRVSPASKVRRSLVAAQAAELLDTVSHRDFDWFVEHIDTEWSQWNHFIRCHEEGYYVCDYENLFKKIKLRYGPDQEVQTVIQTLVRIGMSLQLRELMQYLRSITSGADLPQDDNSDKGKGKANAPHQTLEPNSTTSKRHAEEDMLDLPGPSKHPRLIETFLGISSSPPRSSSPYSCITVEDEVEDRLVRASLSSLGVTPSKTSEEVPA